MQLLNRSAIVVRAKGRYVDWANSVREEGPKFTLDEARTNPAIYLVARLAEDDEDPSDKDLLDARATELFEAELGRWTHDEEKWPATRTPHAFRSWFDVEVIDAVADIDEDELIVPPSEEDLVELGVSYCAWCGTHLADGEVRLVAYDAGPDVEADAAALPVEIDEDHEAIAVRYGEFELAGADDDGTEEDEDEDDDAPTPRRRRDEDDEGDEDEDEEYEDDEDEEDEDEEGWVLACCGEQCQAQVEKALGDRALVEE